MTENLLCAMIGIIGTLLGTIVGWGLNTLSKKGKLNIYLYRWKYYFRKLEKGCFTSCTTKKEAEYFSYDIILEFYNSSGETKIVRDVEILFYKNNKLVWKSIPNDKNENYNSFDDVKENISFNISAKSIKTKILSDSTSIEKVDFNELIEVNKVYISYINDNNKIEKKQIINETFSNYFNKVSM